MSKMCENCDGIGSGTAETADGVFYEMECPVCHGTGVIEEDSNE